MSVAAGSLPAPSGYDPAATANSAFNGDGFIAYRGLDATTQIDLGVDKDYYLSFLTERDVGTRSRSYSLQLQNSSGAAVASTGVSTGGDVNVTLGSSGLASQGINTVGNGSAYLWVIKISAKATDPDQIFVQVYNEVETIGLVEPVTYEVSSNTEANSSVITQFGFVMGSGATFQLDEFRIGESFEDVTITPEPASALLALGGVLLMASRRSMGRG